MKKLRVTVDGKAYEVLVEVLDEDPHAAPQTASVHSAQVSAAQVSAPPAAASAATGGPAKAGDVTGPLAGKVVSIDVAIGARVEANANSSRSKP